MSLFTVKKVSYKDIVTYSDLTITEGRTTFIRGKSGTGKSTLLRLLNASISADKGEILYKDIPISEYDSIELRREVTLVAQNVFLFDDTIRNNFHSFYKFREQPVLQDDAIEKYLKLCMADFSLDSDCRRMSGGERQRVFIAICLSFMPKVLMLDEPTSALDEHTSDNFISSIKNYCSENSITLIAITHNKLIADRYADIIIELDGKKEVAHV